MRFRLAVISVLILVLFLGVSCASSASSSSLDAQLRSIVEPYSFNVASWEAKTLAGQVRAPQSNNEVEANPAAVVEYFSIARQVKAIKTDLERPDITGRKELEAELARLEQRKSELYESVRGTIRYQINGALAEQDIYNPIDNYVNLKANFPPIYFSLEEPPLLLIISPRDKIERLRDILLVPHMSLEEKVDLEAEIDKLGLSSLVVPLGGLATYPSFVLDDQGLRFALDTITEEWMHQYLTFRPLGFMYLLGTTGLRRDYDVATMNETVASMASKEIGELVYKRYYSAGGGDERRTPQPPTEFDFNREMRELRRAVDSYLEQGKVEEAEQLMESRRQYLATEGCYIRKINQAFFAFYGTYADGPTSVCPIGTELRELRDLSSSLKEFLDKTSAMTSHQDLQAYLARIAKGPASG